MLISVPSNKTVIYSRDSVCPDNYPMLFSVLSVVISKKINFQKPLSDSLVRFQVDYLNKCLVLELLWSAVLFFFNQFVFNWFFNFYFFLQINIEIINWIRNFRKAFFEKKKYLELPTRFFLPKSLLHQAIINTYIYI